MATGLLRLRSWTFMALRSRPALSQRPIQLSYVDQHLMEKLAIITSQINEIDGDKVKVDLVLEVGGKICASGDGLFVVAGKKVTQHIIGGIKLMVKPNEGQRLKLEKFKRHSRRHHDGYVGLATA